jgi:hypothetical protein
LRWAARDGRTREDTLGGWSESDIVDFLAMRANPRGIVFGSMSDVIVHTQYMSRDDAVATSRYLKARGVKARRREQARSSPLP